MKKSIPFLAFAVSLLCCCGKTPETPVTPTPQAPTAITLSPTSLSATQAAGSYDLTVTAPARPTLTLPAWITKTDGTYKDYKITFSLKVAANDSYETRQGSGGGSHPSGQCRCCPHPGAGPWLEHGQPL